MAINLDGRQFTGESEGTGEEYLNHAIALQRDATAVYIVDAEISGTSLLYGPRAGIAIERLRARHGPVIESHTLREYNLRSPRVNRTALFHQAGGTAFPWRSHHLPRWRSGRASRFLRGGLEVDAESGSSGGLRAARPFPARLRSTQK